MNPFISPFVPTPAGKASGLSGMASCRVLLLLGIAAMFANGLEAASEASIAASATAGSDYVRPKDEKGALRPESYVFAEGKYFSGGTKDGSLERMTFANITKMMAVSLAKQNYFPATDINAAQLVIMVHWGTTDIYEDPQRELNQLALNEATAAYNASIAESGRADPSALNMALSDREGAQAGVAAAINRNAQLLGYTRALQRERRELNPTTAEITMSNELNEERYFVILMAYDNQVRVKEKKSKPLWITRLSVRSIGNNFTEALPTLAKVGAELFGQNRDDLVRVKTLMQRGSVKLGELEVLGQVGEKAPPARKEK
jgi:hypothetical protein